MSKVRTRAMHKMCANCPFCIASFKTSVALQAHAVYSHRGGFFTCAWCATLIDTELKLQEHARTCTELRQSEEVAFQAFCIIASYCVLCESTFPSHARAIKHYKEIHLHCAYICRFCAKYFHKKDSFVKHCADEHPNQLLHQSVTLPESQMEKPLISERSKADKLELTKEFNEKRCIDCKRCFENITEITKHFQTDHQFEMHVCVKCERGYCLKSSLDSHPCSKIDSSHSTLSDRTKQFRRGILKDYSGKRCSHCAYSFKSSAECSKHFLVKHGSRILVCTKCESGFFSVHSLKYHPCSPPSPFKAEKANQTSQRYSAGFSGSHLGNASEYCSVSYSAVDENDLSLPIQHNGNQTIGGAFATNGDVNESAHDETSQCNGDETVPRSMPILGTEYYIEEFVPGESEGPSMQEQNDEKENAFDTSIGHFGQQIHANVTSNMCSTPMSSNSGNRMRTDSTVAWPAIAEAPPINQPHCEGESNADVDSDVEILEWNPGTDVKPVIKLEMEWN